MTQVGPSISTSSLAHLISIYRQLPLPLIPLSTHIVSSHREPTSSQPHCRHPRPRMSPARVLFPAPSELLRQLGNAALLCRPPPAPGPRLLPHRPFLLLTGPAPHPSGPAPHPSGRPQEHLLGCPSHHSSYLLL